MAGLSPMYCWIGLCKANDVNYGEDVCCLIATMCLLKELLPCLAAPGVISYCIILRMDHEAVLPDSCCENLHILVMASSSLPRWQRMYSKRCAACPGSAMY